MRYDGKIKNGIELKESEGNLFQRIIIKILKKLKGDSEVWYSLSYDEEKHRYFDKNYILSYLRDNYLNNKEDIEPTKLSNDLITFKTYRDDVEQISKNQDKISKIFSLIFTLLSTILGAIGKKHSLFNQFLGIMILVAYINMIWNILRTSSKSESYKLKFITNAIYTLETIKEDMDKYENSRAKYKAMQNKYSPRLCMREKDDKKN